MAVDFSQLKVPDIGRTFSNALLNVRNIESLKKFREEAPLRQRMLEAQTQQQEAAVPTTQQTVNQDKLDKLKSVATISRQIIPDLQAGNPERALTTLQNRLKTLTDAGVNTTQTEEGIALLTQNNPDELLRISQNAVAADERLNRSQGRATTKAFAPVTLVNPKTKEKKLVSPTFDPNTGAAKLSEFDIPEGFQVSKETPEEKRAADVVAAGGKEAAILAEKEKTVPSIAGKTELAKLRAQKGLLPEVKSAVASALSQADAVAKRAGEVRSNETALNVYNTAMEGLVTALGGTTTGPVSGHLPAVSANQQIADGAVAAMAPVLKQMFRQAGEGIFTDKDQELLLEMVPTRKDLPASREAKLKNIDAIIRAKLTVPEIQPLRGQPGTVPAQQQPAAPAQTQVINFDAQGNIVQ